jgi:ornithine cyclodeaminase
MITVLTIADIKQLITKVGLEKFFQTLILALEKEYARWDHFQKSPRHAVHVPDGVIEVMPICDDAFYTFKYVNGHPSNTADNKLTVVALGLLADVKTGYPLMISEMTLLTAFRTAATSALAAKYLAKKDSKTIGIIGTGAQSEFQVLAQKALFDIQTVKYFDIDPKAMQKFHDNLSRHHIKLVPCDDAQSVVEGVDIITTATATKKQTQILSAESIQPGLHINSIGGDCPGKTELDKTILSHAKVVIEYLPQSQHEGEIQQMGDEIKIYAELWELVTGQKAGRESHDEITLFDSVGFAIEDFAILKFVYALAKEHGVGTPMELIPTLANPKNLFGIL